MEALDTAQESVTLSRSLVEKDSALYTPDLASRLGGLGVNLTNLHRHEELLGATEESLY